MKTFTFATALTAMAAGAMAGSQDYDAPYDSKTLYQIKDFYAGSGPKSTATNIHFTISQLNSTDLTCPISTESCAAASSSNNHDGNIVNFPPGPCSASNGAGEYYTFSFEEIVTPPGYQLNITDGSLGFATLFIANSSVTRVQNNADPSQPDPLPNYQISLPGNITFGREQAPATRP